MFGLSAQEKIRKKFKKEGQYALGEVTFVGVPPALMMLNQLTGAGSAKPAVTVKFTTADGEDGEVSCMAGNRIFTVGERVTVRYIRHKGSLLGYIASKEAPQNGSAREKL